MSPSVGYDTTEYEEAEPTQPIAAPDYGEGYRDLPKQLKNALLDCIKKAQASERYIRRQEVLQDAKIRFYDMGIQHVYLNGTYSWTMGTAGAAYSTGPNSKNYFSEYLDDYPILPAFGQIIRAKLSEHDPSVDFQPDDPNDPNDLESAKAAEAMRHDYDRNNDVKLLQQQIIYHWEMGGRCVVWTRSEDAPPRFGDTAGNPPRHVVSTAYGSIEAKVPIFASTLRDCGYCILYDDPDIQDAKEKYDWISPRIDAGQQCLDENAYERIARLGIIQNSAGRSYGWNIGDAVTHLIGRGNIFLRTSRFQGYDDAFEEATEADINPKTGNVLTVCEKLRQLYPDGAHVVVVGQEYAESYNRSMDDCISISHPYIGKGQQRMPILYPMVVVQDRFNQGMNLIAESQDHLVPSTWIGCAATEFAAITKQRAKPGAFRNLKELPSGVKVQDLIYREQDYQIPASAMEFLQFLDGALPQFMLATPPAIWGQAMADNKLMDVNEPIPTPSGFVRNGDLRDGSIVLGEDGNPHMVVKAHPVQTEESYRVTFDDGTFTHVHGGHLWTTLTRNERIQKTKRSSAYRAKLRAAYKPTGTGQYPQQVKHNVDRGGDNYTPKPVMGTVRTTLEIAETLLVGKETLKMGLCVNHSIPLANPIELPHAELPMDPYCLGAWLGDGTSMNGGFTGTDSDCPQILKYFSANGYSPKRTKGPNAWYISGLIPDLRGLGVLGNKHIPHEYLWASVSQRLALLQGLMDTDGCCTNAGRCVFVNTNKALADGVYQLSASLGVKPIFRTGKAALTTAQKLGGIVTKADTSVMYWVEWAATLPAFRMKRKLARLKASYKKTTVARYITSVTPCGPMKMRCITTDNPSGLYLFGKNFNVTHNTSSGLQLAAAQAMGILGALWDMEVQQFAEIYKHNCIAIISDDKYADQVIVKDAKGLRQVVEKASLIKGKFNCYADKDSGFPESTNSQRQSMERTVALLAPTPLGMEIMGEPDNAQSLVRLSGVPIVIPSAIAGEKQQREIEVLLAQEPVIGDPIVLAMLRAGRSVPEIYMAIQQARAQMMQAYQEQLQQQQIEHAGATIAAQAMGTNPPPQSAPPPPPDPTTIAKPSVPIWVSDFHEHEAKKVQKYLTSSECNTELAIGRPSPDPDMNGEMVPNIAGVLNVLLHGEAHVVAIPLTWMPGLTGPLPSVGSPPKMAPQPAGS